MRTPTRALLVLLLVASNLAGSACDDGPDADADADADVDVDPCDTVGAPCGAAGAARCSHDATALERCEDRAGCLVWRTVVDCSASSASCRDVGGDLRCVTECTPDCDVEGELRCEGDLVMECRDAGCLEWVETADCAATGSACEEHGGGARCACVDGCAVEGATRCADSSEVIRRCSPGPDGCLAWADWTDCAAADEHCEETDGAAACTGECRDTCVADGERRCDGDELRACARDPMGCLEWTDEADCAALAPPQVCDETGGAAACRDADDVARGSCADPVVVDGDHFALAGDDFAAEWADHVTLASAGCTLRPGSPDVVIALDLAAGQTVRLSEQGELNVVLSLQTHCGGAGACAFSHDFLETAGYAYTAPVDVRVFAIVESWYPDPAAEGYDIRIDVLSPEGCDDGFDDDGDGETDCGDLDCFGVPPCTTERRCDDDVDEDADGLTDCDDPECADEEACEPVRGIFEVFAARENLDLEGTAIVFTPDATEPMGYDWEVRSPVVAFPYAPGTGATSTALSLGDDAFAAYSLARMASVDFYGVSYDSVDVGSNGYVTLGESFTGFTPSLDEFFARPIVAALFTDLNPAAGGAVTVDEWADRLVVTWDGVPRYGAAEPNDFQIVFAADGTIELVTLEVGPPSATGSTMTGIGSGSGASIFPGETDFVPPA